MENIIKELDQYIEEALFYHDLPGLSVSVEAGEKAPGGIAGLNYKRAAGVKDITTGEKLMPEHIFHMASVSKTFTSSGILMLYEAGKLDLEDKAAELLPYVHIDDKRWDEVRVHHMLAHTSGLTDVQDYHWDKPRTDEEALKDYAVSSEVKDSHLLWSPYENKFCYSNMAYELLGLIIAEVSGMSYEAFMKEKLLKPLGMDDSTFLTFERTGGSLALEDLSRAGMAMPHKKDEERHIIRQEYYPYNRQHGPSSTLTSNVLDLAKWARAHLDKKLFSSELYEQIWTKRATVPNNGEGMGLCWFMREQKGYQILGHEGTDDGFRASFWICPQLDAHVAVASNISRGAVKKINKKLFELLIERA